MGGQCNVDFAIKNRMKQSPLFYAAHFNYLRVMKFLLENNCDVFAADRHGNSVLHFCCSAEAVNLVIDFMKVSGSPALIQEEINRPNNSGNTPLHIAYAFGTLKQIQTLIQKGSDLSVKNKNGNIPHHMVIADRRRLLPLYVADEEA